jgi:hypothetical protein
VGLVEVALVLVRVVYMEEDIVKLYADCELFGVGFALGRED